MQHELVPGQQAGTLAHAPQGVPAAGRYGGTSGSGGGTGVAGGPGSASAAGGAGAAVSWSDRLKGFGAAFTKQRRLASG